MKSTAFVSFLAVSIFVFASSGCAGSGGDKFLGEWKLVQTAKVKWCYMMPNLSIKKRGKMYFVENSGPEPAGMRCFDSTVMSYKDGCLLPNDSREETTACFEGKYMVVTSGGGEFNFQKK